MKTAASKWCRYLVASFAVWDEYRLRGVDLRQATVFSVTNPRRLWELAELAGSDVFTHEAGKEPAADVDVIVDAPLPDPGLDTVVILFESPSKYASFGPRKHFLCGIVYSRKAGLAHELWQQSCDGILGVAAAYDAQVMGECGFFAGPHAAARVYTGLLATTVSLHERCNPTFSDRHSTKKYRGLGIKPQPYYTLRKRPARSEGGNRGVGVKLEYRHKRKGHDRVRVRYVGAEDGARISSLLERGYELYSRQTMTGSLMAKLADRGKRFPHDGELVAIHTRKIEECMVGDESLPFRNTLRIL